MSFSSASDEERGKFVPDSNSYQRAESYGLESTERSVSGEEAALQRQNDELQRQIEELEREIQPWRKMMQDEERYTSSSRDARKMYGDITPGDQTHHDVTLLYQNHFKQAFRTMPKEFPDEDKFKIWQMCADIFQVCFDVKKDEIIDKMKKGMEESLKKDFGKNKWDDDTRDLHRAFKMILSEVNLEELKQKVKKKIPQWNEEMFDFVLHMIQELEPVHYKSFLTNGELQERPLHLYRQ